MTRNTDVDNVIGQFRGLGNKTSFIFTYFPDAFHTPELPTHLDAPKTFGQNTCSILYSSKLRTFKGCFISAPFSAIPGTRKDENSFTLLKNLGMKARITK